MMKYNDDCSWMQSIMRDAVVGYEEMMNDARGGGGE